MTTTGKPPRSAHAALRNDVPWVGAQREEPWAAMHRVPDPDVRASLVHVGTMLESLHMSMVARPVLSGGTRLAIAWNHRVSKHLDFVCNAEAYKHRYARLAKEEDRAALYKATGISVKKVDDRHIAWVDEGRTDDRTKNGQTATIAVTGTLSAQENFDDGSVPGGRITGRALARECEFEHALMPMARVLHGKIAGRTLEGGHVLPRDMHDVLVATRLAPWALMHALRPLRLEALQGIGETIRAHRAKDPEWNGTDACERAQTITAPKYAHWTGAGLWDAAEQFWLEEVDAWIVERDDWVDDRPPPSPGMRLRGGPDLERTTG